MAYERKQDNKIVGDSLDSFVANLADTYSKQTTIRNATEEAKFNEAVLNGNISLDDQLSYRKDQLKQISDDPTERARIRSEVSSLKDRIEQKKFTDAYTEKLMSYSSGLSSLDDVISFLTNQKASSTDPTILDSVNKELLNSLQKKHDLTTQLLKDQTSYAMQNNSSKVIQDQIDRVTSAKTKALISGDSIVSDSLDLQLQALQKSLIENNITNSAQSIAVSNITGASSATTLLDSYNSKISGASANTPITVGGISYPSERDFWTYKRDAYVADQSASGLFDRMTNEITDKIKTASSKGLLNPQLLQSYTAPLSNLGGRPELTGYESKINASVQDLLQGGANLISDTITNSYATNLDLNKAVTDLNTLKAIGVNVDSAYAKIITSGATVKNQQVSSILNAAQTAMQNDPSLTPDKAISMAVSSGAGVVKSPDELVTDPAGKIASDLATSKTNVADTNNPKLNTPPAPSITTTPAPTPTQAPNNNASGFNTITIKSGQSLSQIAAQQGVKMADLISLNGITDPNKIQAGATLKIPSVNSTPAPTSTPSPTPTVTPTATPKPVTTTPTSSPTVTPTPTPTPAPTPVAQKPTPTPAPAAPTVPVTHTIKSGETLSKIASQYGTSVGALATLNNIADPNKIFAGTTIKIK